MKTWHKYYPLSIFIVMTVCWLSLFNPAVPIKSSLIDAISANLIREAYPVCFGSDTRWANHLYPVFLTESFCKSQYIDSNVFLSLF